MSWNVTDKSHGRVSTLIWSSSLSMPYWSFRTCVSLLLTFLSTYTAVQIGKIQRWYRIVLQWRNESSADTPSLTRIIWTLKVIDLIMPSNCVDTFITYEYESYFFLEKVLIENENIDLFLTQNRKYKENHRENINNQYGFEWNQEHLMSPLQTNINEKRNNKDLSRKSKSAKDEYVF